MDTIAFIHQSLEEIKLSQKESIEAITKILTGIQSKLVSFETAEKYKTKEVDCLVLELKEIKKDNKNLIEDINNETKINQKFRNYATAGWIIITPLLSFLLSILAKKF